MHQKQPKDQISVSVFTNNDRGVHRFVIEVPFLFVQNSNFLEAMEGLAMMDIPGWLEALANVVREAAQRSQNGKNSD